jgi:hypothetical protein
VTCDRFTSGTPVSSTNKSDRHDLTEILLKMALNTINQTNQLFKSTLKWPFTGDNLTANTGMLFETS